MKKLAFLFLVLPLAGCPYRYPIEVFNNSGAIVYVHGCSPACESLP